MQAFRETVKNDMIAIDMENGEPNQQAKVLEGLSVILNQGSTPW